MPSDAELVEAARMGDVASLGLLLERYRAPLYGLALRILGHGSDAQDAVHDTFLIAMRKIDEVREPSAVGGWLHAVLRNVCRMRLRAAQGELLFDEVPRHVAHRNPESSAEEAIDRLALREWVWTALARLPETLRVTAMLRYFGSYSSYEEISAILGVPVGTVKSRLNQVKVKLAEALLETAGLEHDEARRLTESQKRYFTAAFDEYNRGQGYENFVGALSDDLFYTRSDGASGGLGWLLEGIVDDLETGVKLHLTNIVASTDVTVVEGFFENPPDDPFHCPPATSQIYYYRDGRVHLMREYFAARPEREDDEATHRREPT